MKPPGPDHFKRLDQQLNEGVARGAEKARDALSPLEAERDRLRDALWQIARDDPEGWAGQKARNALVRRDEPC